MSHRTSSVSPAPPPGKEIRGRAGAEPRRGPAADNRRRASPPPGGGGPVDGRPAVGAARRRRRHRRGRPRRRPASRRDRALRPRRAVRAGAGGEFVEVVPGDGARPGETVLCAHDDRCELARLIRPAGSSVEVEVGPAGRRILLPAGAVLGVATALEQGDLLFDLSPGRGGAAGRVAAALPAGMGRLLEVMARLERLRRPVFPPLFMGGEQRLLDQLTAAYDVEAEIIGRETTLLPEEQALAERYLTRGSGLLAG